MIKWKISFGRICGEEIDVNAETKEEAETKAIDIWIKKNPLIPRTLISDISHTTIEK